MPFALCYATAIFERLREAVVQGLQWETFQGYLDEVIVYGSNVDEHLKILESVLAKLQAAKLKLNPKKCCPFQG